MKIRELASLAASLFPIFVMLPALMACLFIIEVPQALAQHDNEYAIYLSPGFEEGKHWGGYHVTVTGFSDDHAPGKSEKAEARKAWDGANGGKAYSFANKVRGKDYWAEDIGNGYGYGIKFKSDTLDKLAQDLSRKKFKSVRNADGSKNYVWHISLYSKSEKEALETFEKHLKNKPWKLFEVRKPCSDCQSIGKRCDEGYWKEI